jgi:hypothetical protein
MACHIQIFALSRWLSVNLPIEYYEFAKGVEWTIPYMHLPWEDPGADPFMGYSEMPAIELLDRTAVGQEAAFGRSISYPGAQQSHQPPVMPMQQVPLEGKPLTATEYRSFFEVSVSGGLLHEYNVLYMQYCSSKY